MAGGEAGGADLPRHAGEGGEFNVGVAIGAGDGGAAGEILVDERADDARLKLVFEIHDVVGEVEVLGDALGVVDVVDGAAAVMWRACGLDSGKAALIP